jgi:hypothetical protein
MSAKVIRQMQEMPKKYLLVSGNELKREVNMYDPLTYDDPNAKPIKTYYQEIYMTDGVHIYRSTSTTPCKEKNNGPDRYVLLNVTNHKNGRSEDQWYKKIDLLVNTFYGKIPANMKMVYKDAHRKNAIIDNVEFVDKNIAAAARQANKNSRTGLKGICEIKKKTAKGIEVRYRVKYAGKEKNFKTLSEAQSYLQEITTTQPEESVAESEESESTPSVLKMTEEELDDWLDENGQGVQDTEEEEAVYTKLTKNQIITKINQERLEDMKQSEMSLKEYLLTYGLTPYDPLEKGNRDPKIVKLLELEAKYEAEEKEETI